MIFAASASASFFGTFGASGSVSHLNKHTVSDTYTKNVMDSKVYTYGGPPIRDNFTISYWEENLPNNLVAIDREGDPLHYLITTEALPELPEEVVFEMSAMVLKSLQRYYKNNAITGLRKTLGHIIIINLRGVSTKLSKYIVFTMQTYKKLTLGHSLSLRKT